jgi:hypothetical protein
MSDTDPASDASKPIPDMQTIEVPPAENIVPYNHDPSMIPALAQLADAACEGVDGTHEASLRVAKLAKNANPPFNSASVRELTITFAYTLAPHPLGSAQPGADLVPLEGPSYPRALRDADENVRALWISLASSVTHPMAKARCADIVFTLRLAKPHEAAEKAVQAYLELVGDSLSLGEQSDGLLRAWGLVRAVGLSASMPRVSSVMLDMVDEVLDRQDDPYVVVHLLDALTAPQRKKKGSLSDPRVDALLDKALLTYADTRTVSELASLVRRRAAGDAMRFQHASEVEVKAYLNDADKATEAIVKRAHLNDAASKARQLNLPDLEAIAVSRLQSAPPVEWKRIESEFKIPNAFFRDFLRPYKKAESWTDALGAWFKTDAPSGSLESNEATARNVLNQSVFARLVTTIVFGDRDLPKRVLAGDDDAFRHELVRVETFGIRLHGILLADALDLIKSRFGIPPLAEVEARLIEAGAHPIMSRTLAKSLLLYWVGEFEAAVHLAVPKIEAATRALLLELNEPMYRAAVGDAVGVFPGLGALLEPLIEKGFDPDWERFLRTFLLNDGENVRNLTAHGYMDDVNRETAALALRACALLVLIASEDSVNRDSELVKAALVNPIAVPPRSLWQRGMSAIRAARRELLR